MWKMDQIEKEDLDSALSDSAIDWSSLKDKTVLVSGATGLIGQALTKTLLYCGCGRVIAMVRDIAKAEALFCLQIGAGCRLSIYRWNAEEPIVIEESVDYIIHCASQTSSRGFLQTPVDTIRTAYLGTEHVLSFAKEKHVKNVVYLSTMEVYGTPQDDEKIAETYLGRIDSVNVRSCYPESKKLCESLCVSYSVQYHVPVCIARLTQTFGPGISVTDGRVFAEFARCVLQERDIVLHTKGETKRNYLYTADAVRALILLALKGKEGQAYNIANEATYCTIYEMAQMVAHEIAKDKIAARVELDEDINKYGYAPVLHMNLDTRKVCQLGWQPKVGLCDMFRRMISAFDK